VIELGVLLVLAFTSLGAATVNGALGYGYSSISVPIALLVVAGRVLNPALVVIEVVVNLYALVIHRKRVHLIARRVLPLSIGLIPGVIAGALLLGVVSAGSAKLTAYAVLLPLIIVQASGRRFPIKNERAASIPLGAGTGVLYGMTTISGPPLALFWNNQGLAKDDFKVALALIRSIESVCALLAYAYLGLLTTESAQLLPWLAPGVLIGFPLGHWLIRRLSVETFRRVCMSFDAYLVSFGLARTLTLAGVSPLLAYQAMTLTAIVDSKLLWDFFKKGASRRSSPAIERPLEASPEIPPDAPPEAPDDAPLDPEVAAA
jgi:uncharacterized membrane protein YfcA